MSYTHSLALFVMFTAALPFPVLAADFYGKVVKVTDGDSIVVTRKRKDIKIQLAGIDCPEINQPFGKQAKEFTSSLAFAQVVTVKEKSIDKSGTITADIILFNGVKLNQQLVRSGLAWWYREHAPNDQTLADMEAKAKAGKLGLWATKSGPIAPWKWRNEKHKTKQLSVIKVYKGNTRARVFHRPGCQYYDCRVCFITFDSRDEAIKSGYKPCMACDQSSPINNKIDADQLQESLISIIHDNITGSVVLALDSTTLDRNNGFTPETIKKSQADALEENIIALYSLGMSYREIKDYLAKKYGLDISPATLSAINDKIIPQIKKWQSRSLESVYPFAWLDAIHYKAMEEDGRTITKAVYTVLGVGHNGKKDVLGIYISDSARANFWMGVFTDLQNRGVQDILIASAEGLKGLPEAINKVFPKTEVQLCIVHQILNSDVSDRDQKDFMMDLKQVYRATSKDLAEQKLLKLDEKWGEKYPIVIGSWQNNWEKLSTYFKYPEEIRRIIYTTDIIEGTHRSFRKLTKTNVAFTRENALLKFLYLGIKRVSSKWMTPVRNWKQTISQLAIMFKGRIRLDQKSKITALP